MEHNSKVKEYTTRMKSKGSTWPQKCVNRHLELRATKKRVLK